MRRYVSRAVIVLMLATVCGCQNQAAEPDDRAARTTRELTPTDFAAAGPEQAEARARSAELTRLAERLRELSREPASPAPVNPPDAPPLPSSDDEPDSAALAETVPPIDRRAIPSEARRSNDLTLDAMVGQINGRPIYASEVFEPIDETLQRIGATEPRLVFQRRAAELIVTEMRSRVQQALVLAQAERDLDERQQLGILGYLKQEREKLINQFGEGVASIANERLIRDTGRTLEEELEFRRQKLLAEKLLREKIHPKIHVDRRMVERYWRDHQARFNQPPVVQLRVIVVKDASAAEAVEAALRSGEEFAAVARAHSTVKARDDGLMPKYYPQSMAEFEQLPWPALNEKVRTLKVGEHTSRTEIALGLAWVKLESVEGGESFTLQQKYNEIERLLRNQQYVRLQQQFMQDLLDEGNYTPLAEMTSALLDVAMARYARPL